MSYLRNDSLTTEWFDDQLQGTLPLPKLGKLPTVISISSQGIDLDLSLTDSSLTYKAVSKPVARSSLQSNTVLNQEKESEESDSSQESKEVERTSWKLPWWVYVIIIIGVLILAGRAIKKIKIPF